MIHELLIDPETLDINAVAFDKDAILAVNPQRFEMEQLDRIIKLDVENGLAVGLKQVRDDEFWVKGHIPGRPLMPGALIVECAAQLCSFCFNKALKDDRFLGFGGIDGVKFRYPVLPGSTLIMIAKATELKRRRATFHCQGIVDGKLVFEGTIIGMPV